MKTSQTAVVYSHRPRRVVFLVDREHELLEVLNSIRQFNLNAWGGRHNPILLTAAGELSATEKSFLQIVDPDVVYSFGPIAKPVLEFLLEFCAPLTVETHKARGEGDFKYSIDLGAYQLSLRNYFPAVARRKVFFQQEIAILDFNDTSERQLSEFFKWNFGLIRWSYSPETQAAVKFVSPKSTNDADLLKLLAENRELTWATAIAGDAPLQRHLQRKGINPYSESVPLFVGGSVANIVGMWNSAWYWTRTQTWKPPIEQLWVTDEIIADKDKFEALALLLTRRLASRTDRRSIRLVSFDKQESELLTLQAKLNELLKWNAHVGEVAQAKQLFERPLEPAWRLELTPKPKNTQFFLGESLPLDLSAPEVEPEHNGQYWMVDLRVYEQADEWADQERWWRLPHRNHRLFGQRLHRTLRGGEISFQVDSSTQILHLQIPDEMSVFREFLTPHPYAWKDDERRLIKQPKDLFIRTSAIGKYTQGIVNLFGTLDLCCRYFTSPFWSSVLEKLSVPSNENEVISTTASRLSKHLPKLKSQTDVSQLSRWLSRQVVQAASSLQVAVPFFRTSEVTTMWEEYVKAMPEEDQSFYGSERGGIKDTLSELLTREVLIQGTRLRCAHCLLNEWYSVTELDSLIKCHGCPRSFSLPLEPEWFLRANELVRSGIRYHGVKALFQTLSRIKEDTNDLFLYMPGVEFMEWEGESATKKHEIDLAWIKDGLLGIAEVKSSTDRIESDSVDSLIAVAQLCKPNIVAFGAPTGTDKQLESIGERLRRELSPKCEVHIWGPSDYQHRKFWSLDKRLAKE